MPVPGRRLRVGSPVVGVDAVRVLLLGGGELGKEIALAAQGLGFEVVVVDRYDWAPAMHVAHRRYVVDLLDGGAVRAVVRRERPTVVIPEIEAVDVDALRELEEEGFTVVPNAEAVRIAMNRVELRRFAAERLGLPTTRYGFAESWEEVVRVCEDVGYPCLVKPEMSSSGHGHVVVRGRGEAREAYEFAVRHARGRSRRVVVEEYVRLRTELTVLAYRWVGPDGRVVTDTMEPIEHQRHGAFHYVESWQPCVSLPHSMLEEARRMAVRVAEALGGVGVFGVEFLVTEDGRLLFSEVAPRPHDTGLVTLLSQDLSEFHVHVLAAAGLPVPEVTVVSAAASYAVYTDLDGVWAPHLSGVYDALLEPGVVVRWFGKPVTYPGRRMAVVIARGASVEEARAKARRAASKLRVEP